MSAAELAEDARASAELHAALAEDARRLGAVLALAGLAPVLALAGADTMRVVNP